MLNSLIDKISYQNFKWQIKLYRVNMSFTEKSNLSSWSIGEKENIFYLYINLHICYKYFIFIHILKNKYAAFYLKSAQFLTRDKDISLSLQCFLIKTNKKSIHWIRLFTGNKITLQQMRMMGVVLTSILILCIWIHNKWIFVQNIELKYQLTDKLYGSKIQASCGF